MVEKLHAIVRFDGRGEVICFCSYEEYLRGRCECRETHDCPEAMIEITVLPNSRPSEQDVQKVTSAEKKITETLKKVTKETNRIKLGVARLEKAIKGSRFRI